MRLGKRRSVSIPMAFGAALALALAPAAVGFAAETPDPEPQQEAGTSNGAGGIPYEITIDGHTYEQGDDWPTEGCEQGAPFGLAELSPGTGLPLLTLCGEQDDGAVNETVGIASEGDLDILVLGFNEVLYPDSDNPTPAIDVQGKLNIYGGEGDERDPKLVENRLQLFA